jgi:hypothetical protein
MSKLTASELSRYKKLLSITRKDGSDEHFADLEKFEERMDKKYGSWDIIPVKKSKGGMMKKKGMAKGGMKKKGYAAGGLKMVEKDGQKVPFYAADGIGKMNKGGMKKKGYAKGGAGMKKKAYAKGGKVAMYNVGGMFKSSTDLKTGVARPKNTYK